MNNNKTTGQKLANLSKGKRSGWAEKAAWRKANRGWLRKSAEIGIHILDSLQKAGMSQKDFSDLMGVSAQFVSRIARGEENLTLQTIDKIEKALGVELVKVTGFLYQAAAPIQRAASNAITGYGGKHKVITTGSTDQSNNYGLPSNLYNGEYKKAA